MAISWEVEITPLSMADKTVSVHAIRTDSEDSDSPRAYDVAKAPIDTPAQKLAVMDEIWAKHQAALAKEATIAAFIDGLETQAKQNLEARE